LKNQKGGPEGSLLGEYWKNPAKSKRTKTALRQGFYMFDLSGEKLERIKLKKGMLNYLN